MRFHLAACAALMLAACGSSPSHGAEAGPPSGPASAGAGCATLAALTGDIDDRGTVSASSGTVALKLGDSFFQPTCVTGVHHGAVTVTVRNEGSFLHNFSAPDQTIDQDVEAGQSITVKVTVASTVIPFFCKYHRTSGMQGALVPQTP